MIRPATTLDLPWLRKLYGALCLEIGTGYPVTDEEELDTFIVAVARALTTDTSFSMTVLTDAQDHPVGFLGYGIMLRLVGKPKQVLSPYWMYLEPPYRRQGFVRSMAAEMLAWARTHWPQVTVMEIAARPGSDRWQGLGAQPFLVYHVASFALADDYIAGKAPAKVEAPSMTNGKHKPRPRPRQHPLTDVPEVFYDG